MSTNLVNPTTGATTQVANGQRVASYTKAAYEAAKQAGTLPKDSLVMITDDVEENLPKVLYAPSTNNIRILVDNCKVRVESYGIAASSLKTALNANLTSTYKPSIDPLGGMYYPFYLWTGTEFINATILYIGNQFYIRDKNNVDNTSYNTFGVLEYYYKIDTES